MNSVRDKGRKDLVLCRTYSATGCGWHLWPWADGCRAFSPACCATEGRTRTSYSVKIEL